MFGVVVKYVLLLEEFSSRLGVGPSKKLGA